MPSFLMIQWGIVGFFVLIHFIIGFLRGTSKSTYYTIVSLIMTVVTLWLVSFVSLNLIFSSEAILNSLIQLVNRFAGNTLPVDIETILEPEVIGLIVIVGDIVIKIISFLLLYPFVKFFLTLIIFRPIWKHIVLPKILSKQNDKALVKHEIKYGITKKFVPRKKLKKNIFSRFVGGAVGSFRGLVVAFVFLAPLLVIAGFASEFNNATQLNQEEQNALLTTGAQTNSALPSEIQEILDNIDDLNQNGLGYIVKDIKVQEKSLDRYIFDQAFTTSITVGEEKTAISYANELEQIIGIAQSVIEAGYLNEDFEIEDISSDDLVHIEKIFNHLGNSNILTYMIPAAINFGSENLDDFGLDMLDGLSFSEREKAQAALDNFKDISWKEEFNRIYGIADATLTFASVGEWMMYMDQPGLLAELSPEEGVLLANILRSVGELEVLTLLNVAIDYATTLEEVQSQISWMDPEEVEPYLQDKFAYILDDPDYFIGEEGEIARIAQIIETIFSDEFGDSNLSTLINSMGDPESLINNQNPEWVGAILEDLVEVRLLVESIPVGVDYVFYTNLKEKMTEELADDIAAELEQIEWDNELLNVGDIYKEALKLGIGRVFGENPDYYAFIDDVALNHIDEVRQIVEYIFEGSQVVNVALELASDSIIETAVSDVELQEVFKEVLMSEASTGEVDFNFGQEINNLLTIVESVNKFSSFTEIGGLSGLGTEELLQVVSQFSTLNETEYETLRDAFNELQILTRPGETTLNYLQSKVSNPNIYIPNSVALNQEVVSILDLSFVVSQFLENESGLYENVTDINLEGLLQDPDFRAFFINSTENKHSNLLLVNAANFVKNFVETGTLSNFTSMPDSLNNIDVDSDAWKDEASALVEAVFEIIIAASQTSGFELSYNGIMNAVSDTSKLPIDALYQMTENDTFLKLFDSDIIHKLVSDMLSDPASQEVLVNAVNQAQSIFEAPADFFAADPAMMDGDLIKPEEFENIIIAVHVLGLTDVGSFSGINLDTFTGLLDRNIDSETGDDDFDRVFGANYIYMILDKVLKLETLGTFVGSTLGGALGVDVVDFDTTPSEAMLASDTNVYEPIEIGKVPKEEFKNILNSIRLLGDIGALNLNTFTDMIEPSEETDTFTEFLESDYIYTIMARLFGNAAFGDYIGEALSGAFSENPIDLNMDVPSDAKGLSGVEEDLMTKSELRNLMVSFTLLGDPADIGIDSIMYLIGLNRDPVTDEDDMDRMLKSIYLQDKMSVLLLSDAILDLVANDLFIADDFVLPVGATVEIDGRDRLADGEIRKIFVGLNKLGIETQESLSTINENTLFGLTEEEITTVVDSEYLYTVIDLMLKGQTSFVVPVSAYYDSSDPVYPDKIIKAEIVDVVKAISIMEVSSPGEVAPEAITIKKIKDVLAETDSAIVQSLVSDAIIQAVGADNVPTDAYDENNLLKTEEIEALVAALEIIAGDEETAITEVIVEDVTVGQASNLDLSEDGSVIIKQLISNEVLNIIDPGDLPEDAYYTPLSSNSGYTLLSTNLETTGMQRLSDTELSEIIAALYILADDPNVDLVENPDFDPNNVKLTAINANVAVGQAVQLKTSESFVIRQMITNQVGTALGEDLVIHNDAYDQNYDSILSAVEISNLLDAMLVLANNDEKVLVTNISTDVTAGQTQGLKNNESLIIRQLITDQIKNVLSTTTEIPTASYDPDKTDMFTLVEVNAMLDALYILADNNPPLGDPEHDPNFDVNKVLVSEIKTDVNVGQTQELRDNTSLIIRQLVTNQMEEVLTTVVIPDEAYESGTTYLTTTEMGQIIDAIDILGNGDDDLPVSEIETDVNVGQTKSLKVNQSLIIRQLISDQIVSALSLTTTIPDAAYTDITKTKLTDTEINDMIDAIVILSNNDDTLPVANIDTDITIGQMKELNLSPSVIIKQVIKESVVDAIALDHFPDGVYDVDNYILTTEVDDIIAALEVLAYDPLEPEKDLNTVKVSLVSTNVTVGHTQDLKLNESLIINQMISEQIVSTITLSNNTIPNDAYTDPQQTTLKDSEIDDMIDALFILANEDETIYVEDIDTDITIGQLKGLTSSSSLIMEQLITDSIVSSVGAQNTPDDAYIDNDSANLLKPTEIDHMILALEIMAQPVADVNVVKISSIGFDITVAQSQSLEANESVIIKQVSSNNIVTMLTTASIEIPVTAYNNNDSNTRLTNDEIGYLIDVLDDLAPTADTKVSQITVTPSTIEVSTLIGFDRNSIVLNRVISTGLIQNMPNIPIESFVEQNPLEAEYKKDILRVEIDNVLQALDTLGEDTNGAGSIGANDISFDEIDGILALGTPASTYPQPTLDYSPIITHIMSTPMIESVSDVRSGHDYGIPSTAYRNDYDLQYEEVTKLVEALKVIGEIPNVNPTSTSIGTVATSIQPSSFGPTLLDNLINVESLIVYRMISIGINDAGIANEDAKAVSGDDNYDPELPLTPVIYDIKILEMEHIVLSMNILGVSSVSTIDDDITVAKLKSLTNAEIEDLVEAISDGPNTIIYYIISDVIDPTNTLYDYTLEPNPDDFYVLDNVTSDRIRLKRTSITDALSRLP